MASSLPLSRTLLNSAGKSLSRQLKLNHRMIQYFNGFYSIQLRYQSSDGIIGKVAAKEPFQVDLVEGIRYSWCRCGYSDKQPFCDGKHRKYAPSLSPVRFKAKETETVFLCGCKQTLNAPFCDGTHMSDKVQNAITS